MLFEISTDKVDTEVPSPVAGVLSEILANEGDLVEVGQVLARVGEAAEPPVVEPPPAEPAQDVVEPAAAREPPPQEPEPSPEAVEPTPQPEEPQAAAAPSVEGIVLSPVVRRLISENTIDPSTLTGTGLGGRITRADVEQAIRARAASERDDTPSAEAAPPPPPPPPASRPAPSTRPSSVPAVVVRSGDSVVPLNNVRRRTAEHMVMSKQTSPTSSQP